MKRLLIPMLVALTTTAQAEPLSIAESDATITIKRGDTPILTYHKSAMPPPAGASPLYARSGFIHPLHSPSGGVVTSIHAPDHIHHMGLWHAWVNTEHDGRELDFWNLKKGTATIGYVKTLRIRDDGEIAGFAVEQHHRALDPNRTILEEVFTVAVRHEDGTNIIDYDTVQKNITDHPLKFPAYRYGGPIAYRAPQEWNDTNSDYLTSEGKTRADGHTTRAKWVAMSGPTKKGDATLAILCHPKNHDAPQRTRIWTPKKKGDFHGGKIFFNYVPIQETPWQLDPGKPSSMRYRIIIADGKPDAKNVDAWWKTYAQRDTQ